MTFRGLVTGSTGAVRREMFNGKEHLVAPVIALVEGVIHASNSESAELVRAKEFSRAPSGWNGRPIYVNHPQEDGAPVSGNSPTLLQEQKIGTVFNASASAKDKQLRMEAWVDPDVLRAIDPGMLKRLETGEPIEVSVGAFVETNDVSGSYNGRAYRGEWSSIVPDHLALLPFGIKGACSNEMGCGVRAASMFVMEEFMTAEQVQVRYLKRYSQEVLDAMPAADFAGKNKSFPIKEPGDVNDAARSIGRAGPDNYSTDELKRRIIAIAKRKGAAFVAQLPDAWKQKNMAQRVLEFFRVSATVDMSDSDVRSELTEILNELEPRLIGVTDVYSDRVVYGVTEPTMGYGCCYYQRAYSGEPGSLKIDGDRVEVERVTSWVPVGEEDGDMLAAACAALRDAAGARHSAGDQRMVQDIHDYAGKLGAKCAGMKAAAEHPCQCGEKDAKKKDGGKQNW